MNANELGFVIVSLFVIVFAVVSYLVVRIWGEKKQ
jgi:hypothetical protein